MSTPAPTGAVAGLPATAAPVPDSAVPGLDAEIVAAGRGVGTYFRFARWEGDEPGPGGFARFGGSIPIDPVVRSEAGGLGTGAMLSMLDSLGGQLCGMAVRPQWIVTSNLMLQVVRFDHVGPIRMWAEVLRRGRTACVGQICAVDEGNADAVVAVALATMAVLDPSGMRLEVERPVRIPLGPFHPDQVSIPEYFALSQPGGGPVVRMDLSDRMRNPWGILHGGGVGIVAEAAALAAVAVANGEGREGRRPRVVGDTTVHYLSPGRTGPIEARPEVLGRRGDAWVVAVEVVDVGEGGRTMALAEAAVHDVEPPGR